MEPSQIQRMKNKINIIIAVATTIFCYCLSSCQPNTSHASMQQAATSIQTQQTAKEVKPKNIELGAQDTAAYFNLLKGKNVGLTANATSVVEGKHLLDFLLENGITVKKIFAPEHGFRGDAEPGQTVNSTIDPKTNVKIASLFGKTKKPTTEMLKDIDIMVYDMQSVGVRFFTYISTMHYVMEACAENNIPVIILDRPNPNIDYTDGPIRNQDAISFVSTDPIPLVYGTTDGELAKMINGEGWLKNGVKCNLTIIPVKNYDRKTKYIPPVKPSPNLPNYLSIRLYPSLCLFEATVLSVGRGTDRPFTSVGYPNANFGEYVFTPQEKPGMMTNPKHKSKKCYGTDFSALNPDSIKFTLKYFFDYNKKCKENNIKMIDRPEFLKLLYGNNSLTEMLDKEISESQIKQSYADELKNFIEKRKKYLIYK